LPAYRRPLHAKTRARGAIAAGRRQKVFAGIRPCRRCRNAHRCQNPEVASWDASCGALPLPQKPLSLVMPFRTIRTALESAGKL
jgi:methylphosphotriester-DNA--protein-cysteine methyltransferase